VWTCDKPVGAKWLSALSQQDRVELFGWGVPFKKQDIASSGDEEKLMMLLFPRPVICQYVHQITLKLHSLAF
jgi:hypothetical protein